MVRGNLTRSGMATEITREEFVRLETRVSAVEQEGEGEKMVTRHILEQTRHNADDLAAIKSHLARHDQRFDDLERRFDGSDRKGAGLERKVDDLIKNLPKMISEVLREVFDERDRKR